MSKKIYFLKDSEINDWLIEGFYERNFPITFMGIENVSQTLQNSRLIRILKLHFGYIKLVVNCLFKSKKGDVIVCLLDVLALYLFLLSKLTFKSREVIVINVMLNDQNDFINKKKLQLFKLMLKSKHIHPTVTSNNLIEYYKKLFDLPDKDFYLLHDCYGKLGKYKKSYNEGSEYVFCGGSNGRDWEVLLKTADLLPDVNFVIVGPKKDTLGNHGLTNIDYYFDIPFQKFQELIKDCSLLALPLNTQAPAGLIVIFTAGLMSKPVISTDNATLREYITTEDNGILVKLGDYEKFAKEISLLVSNPQKLRLFGERLNKRIEDLGSPQVFVDKIISITNQINFNENPSNK
jgi:glycosyltransferase involved in cell wall biosynthesis